MAISLASIARTTRAATPPRVVVHGEHGVGKSTLGARAHKPIFLPFEDGLAGIETDAFPLIERYEDALAAVAALAAGGHDFGTVVIDSADWLEPLIWAHVCKQHGWASIEQPGYGKGYVEANTTWREFLDALDGLRSLGMAVMLIAHSEIKHFDAPDTDAYDRYQIKLQRGAAAIVQEWADIIGFAQIETAIKKEAAGFGGSRARGVATGRRVLRVVGAPAYVAKNRYDMPPTLPLEWAALVDAMAGGGQPAAPAPPSPAPAAASPPEANTNPAAAPSAA